jgi:hypothetical protein
MKNFLKKIIKSIFRELYLRFENKFLEKNEKVLFLKANEIIQNRNYDSSNINKFEFSIFSQWGDDGIINYLINNIEIANKKFVELGVEDYLESNTRFLMQNNNWSGFIVDGNCKLLDTVKSRYFYWKYDLKALCKFIDRENINEIINYSGFHGNIGLLSIDLDGNDFWIWKNLNTLDPDIVVIEYNYRYGPEKSVSTPYDKNFNRFSFHESGIVYGSSLKALAKLGKEKGMSLVGTNLAGNNAYFVKSKFLSQNIREKSVKECFNSGKFREHRDINKKLTFKSIEEEKKILNNIKVEEV